jgi:hypothetical protein
MLDEAAIERLRWSARNDVDNCKRFLKRNEADRLIRLET